METVTEVPENIGSFIQMVTVFEPEEFVFMFFMDLWTVDSSASELVGRKGEGGISKNAGKVERRKEEREKGRKRNTWMFGKYS